MGRGKIGTLLLSGACAVFTVGSANAADLGADMSLKDAAPPIMEEARKLELSGGAILTTDYIFRGLSFSDTKPSVQAYFNAGYGIFYIGAWALSADFQSFDDPNDFTVTDTVSIEIDYYAGIAPSYRGWDFDFSALYYTFPQANDRALETNYFELHTHVATNLRENLRGQFGINWSPDYSFETGDAWTFEGKLDWTLPAFGRFTPTLGGLIGYTLWTEDSFLDDPNGIGLEDYLYWNVGLNLAFHENWSVDVRYWDTNLNEIECGVNAGRFELCKERVVGTLTATF